MKNPFYQLETEEDPPCVHYEATLELPRLQIGDKDLGRSVVLQLWGRPVGAHVSEGFIKIGRR